MRKVEPTPLALVEGGVQHRRDSPVLRIALSDAPLLLEALGKRQPAH